MTPNVVVVSPDLLFVRGNLPVETLMIRIKI